MEWIRASRLQLGKYYFFKLKTRKVILCLWLISSVPLVKVFFDALTSYIVLAVTITVCLASISFAWIRIYQVVRNHQVQIQDQMAVATQSFNMARLRNSAINTFLVLVIVLLRYTPFLLSKICLTVNLKRSNVVFVEICYTFCAPEFIAESICVFLASAWREQSDQNIFW